MGTATPRRLELPSIALGNDETNALPSIAVKNDDKLAVFPRVSPEGALTQVEPALGA